MCGFIQQISARDARTASSKHPSGQGTPEVPLRRPRVPQKGELAHASSFDAGAKRRRGLAVLYCLVGVRTNPGDDRGRIARSRRSSGNKQQPQSRDPRPNARLDLSQVVNS